MLPSATAHKSFDRPRIVTSSGLWLMERRVLFWLVFAPALAHYLWLLAPTVTGGGDGGELIAASYTLGIAHPSGYPLWSLIGRIFALLPVGEIGWRYNLFSAVAGALAAGILAVTTHRIVWNSNASRIAKIGAALTTGWLFAGYFQVASQFLIAEIYALAALFNALLLWQGLKWHQERDWRDFYALIFLIFLVPSVHLSSVFIAFWLGAWALASAWRELNKSRVAWASVFAVLALAPLFYFPIRASLFPAPPPSTMAASFYYPLDWTHPVTFSAWLQHITAAQYRILFAPSWAKLGPNLLDWANWVFLQLLWATPLLFVGAFAALRRNLSVRGVWFGVVLLLIFASNLGTQIHYEVPDRANFFFPAYAVMALWLGLGFWAITSVLERLVSRPRFAQNLALAVLAVTAASQWMLASPALSMRGSTRPRDIALEQLNAAQELAERAKRPAFVMTGSKDVLWTLWYGRYVLKAAPDVATPWGRLIEREGKEGRWVAFVDQLRARGPVTMAAWDAATDARFPLVPLTNSGSLWLASNRNLPLPATPIQSDSRELLQNARFRPHSLWHAEANSPTPNLVHLQRGTLSVFEVEFAASDATPRSEDWVWGHVEVLTAPANFFGASAPTNNQREIGSGSGSGDAASITVKIQRRRLVLPASASAGNFRASVPIEAEITAPPGRFEVWTRLLSPEGIPQTPWKKTDEVVFARR